MLPSLMPLSFVDVTIYAKAINIYRKSKLAWAAILDLYYGVSRPPAKPRWWLEEAYPLLLALPLKFIRVLSKPQTS